MEGKTARHNTREKRCLCDAYVQTLKKKKLSGLLSSKSNFERKVLKCLFNNGEKQDEKQLCLSLPILTWRQN